MVEEVFRKWSAALNMMAKCTGGISEGSVRDVSSELSEWRL